MTAPGFCSICNFKTVKFGDVKSYLLDRTDEFAIYDKDNEGYTIMCCKSWKEQGEIDKLLYGKMNTTIKALTWDKPLPKDHQETAPTIIKTLSFITILIILTSILTHPILFLLIILIILILIQLIIIHPPVV